MIHRHTITMVEFELPVITYSPNHAKMNPQSKGGKIAKSNRIKETRALFCASVRNRIGKSIVQSHHIILTRVSVGKLDYDNLVSALKPARDGVADGLGLKSDKDSDVLKWEYEQASGGVGYYGVRVKIDGVV